MLLSKLEMYFLQPSNKFYSHKLTQISVVIVNYNSGGILQACLLSVLRSTVVSEIIVVDNASGPPTQKVLDDYEQHEWVRVIRNDDNRGFAAANNQALRQAKGRYFMLLPRVRSEGL